jgi:hypothetical protein
MKKAHVLAIVGGFIVFIITVWAINLSASEIKLRNQIEAQIDNRESYFDKMWKVISQKAEVTEKYKESFKEIYPELIEGRYGNEKGGALMKWITESNPTFDASLYKDLMQSIEAERMGFFLQQQTLIDLNAEHKSMRNHPVNWLVIGSRPDVKFKIISSDKTKKIMEEGLDNDVSVF